VRGRNGLRVWMLWGCLLSKEPESEPLSTGFLFACKIAEENLRRIIRTDRHNHVHYNIKTQEGLKQLTAVNRVFCKDGKECPELKNFVSQKNRENQILFAWLLVVVSSTNSQVAMFFKRIDMIPTASMD